MRMIVVHSPLWAVTAADGSFKIPSVPKGDYRVTAIRYDSINLRTGRANDKSDPLRISISDSDLNIGKVKIGVRED